VQDGVITGGSLTENVKHNDFLATTKTYQNFDLNLKIKITGAGGFINSGIQIRSVRVPGNTEMSGYQVDAGEGWWGKLYDESRRNKVVGEAADLAAVNAGIKKDGWNEYRILAEGPRLRTWINGVPALDYTEKDPGMAEDGHIGLQAHSGGKVLVQVKEITIKELPPTPGAPTWEKLGGYAGMKAALDAAKKPQGNGAAKPTPKPKRDISYNQVTTAALTPQQQLATFTVPPGFQVELVAAETEGVGKFITVAWDHAGRMWSMTALDYPVDANENRAYAEALYKQGGRDKLVVYDKPYGPGPHTPRIFAEGLAIPLGILPHGDGVYAQHGAEIRHYRDKDGDGRADGFETVLTGFGIDDSHLFAHQFMPGPGGWIYLAQGAFNHGEVRRPDGKPFATGGLFSPAPQTGVPFSFCKLARMRPDGSDFQLVSSGPNNIWGLVMDRTGEMFMQEANDMGYPIIPFRPGTHVPGVGSQKLKPYAPVQPPSLSPPQMGGTGLSGLALKEDGGWPEAWVGEGGARVFYLANPITNRVQAVRAVAEGSGYKFEKMEDFMTSTDPWFRPIAIHFGPDGCLYVVDWCNKIISHNEVPRVHPDRDKTRGRIWRIRHQDQPPAQVPDLTQMPSEDLLLYLESPGQWAQRTAWQELVQRGAKELVPTLRTLSTDLNKSTDTRIHALWVWEELRGVDTTVLTELLRDEDRDMRRETARAMAAFAKELGPERVAYFLKPLVADADAEVRSAALLTLNSLRQPDLAAMDLMVRFTVPPAAASPYERDFQRYLARAALEQHPALLAAFLDTPAAAGLPAEGLLFAALALPEQEGLRRFIKAFPAADRGPTDEEVVLLLKAPVDLEPEVSALLGKPAHRAAALEAVVRQRDRIDRARGVRMLQGAAVALGKEQEGIAASELLVNLAAAFPMPDLAPRLVAVALDSAAAPEALRVRAIDTLGSLPKEAAAPLAPLLLEKSGSLALRAAALAALAPAQSEVVSKPFAALWPQLSAIERSRLTGRLAAAKPGAQVLLAAIQQGVVKDSEIDATLLERLQNLFPEDPAMKALWDRMAKDLMRVLRLNGQADSYVDSNLTLGGPFTVETWIKLEEGIGNEDGILANGRNLDLNFFGGKFRVYVGGTLKDVVVAQKTITPGAWTHVAVTRDAQGVFRLYLNGELDATGTKTTTEAFAQCDIGRTSPGQKGTAGEFTEYRVWRTVRSAEEIRDHFDRTFAGEPAPGGLVLHHSPLSEWEKRTAATQVASVLAGPHLLSAAEAGAQAAKLEKYKGIALKSGDAKAGQVLFGGLCLSCHTLAGKGANLAPALDGSGHRDLDGLLRALLTPNAAVEGGYRAFRVETKDNRQVEGFLVTRDAAGITLRLMGGAELRFPMAEVNKAEFTNRSLMIEGLIEGLPDAQVTDLFEYLRTLK
jgi:putative membrane-bound dehydrogenase-like protein